MKTMTDSELKCTCYGILSEKVGDLDTERFIALVNRDAFDYTQWRRRNLGVGETVDSLYGKIRDFSSANQDVECENRRQDDSCAGCASTTRNR